MQNSITLPLWLDNLIFKELKAHYRPRYSDMTNIDDDKEKTLNYLGAYLPQAIREKVLSFQKDYAPGGYYYGRDDCPRTNDNTIKHFINKCTYQKGQSPSWLPATPENKQLLENLKHDLENRYAQR